MKTAYTTSVIAGGLLILGAAGGCDLGSASLTCAIMLMLAGFALCIFGLLTPKYISRRNRSRILRIRKAENKAYSAKQKRIAPANDITEARKSFVLIKEI